MLNSILNYQYMQNAVIASILAGIVCGIMGVIIIEKKLVMMSGGIAHTAYGGVGLGYMLGIEPVFGAILFSTVASLSVGYIKRKGTAKSDVIIGMFWSLGMALGILFITLTPGYPPNISTYLFGNILSIPRFYIKIMGVLTLLILLVTVIFFNHWKVYLFDDEFAYIVGIKTALLEYVLMVMIALTIVVLIRVVGIILVLALLTAPSATAALLTNNLKNRMIWSSVLVILFCMTGLWISYNINLAPGSVIVIMSVGLYFIIYAVKYVLKSGSVERWSLKRS